MKKTGRPQKNLNEKETQQLITLAGYGLRYQDIASILGVSERLLQGKYKAEFNIGKSKACANVLQRLYKRALVDDRMTIYYLDRMFFETHLEKQQTINNNIEIPKIIYYEHSDNKKRE